MTRLARRDGVATLLVAAVILCYVGHLTGSMPFVRTPNGMAAIGLILGFVACVVGGWSGGVEAPTVDRLPATMGILTATVGLTVLVTANSCAARTFHGRGQRVVGADDTDPCRRRQRSAPCG